MFSAQPGPRQPGVARIPRPRPLAPSATLDEAEAIARELGVGQVRYAGLAVPAADLANTAFSQARDRGHALPATVATTVDAGFLRGGYASYDPANDTLWIDHRNPFWSDPAGEMAHQYHRRMLASDEPVGVFFHEIGHCNHFLAIGHDQDRWLAMHHTPLSPALRRRVRAELGEYAAASQLEFVAEVYHGRMVGEAYSDEIVQAYNGLGGPKL